jgi:ribosomal-protein-alanine N-acetyltransferase
LTLFYFPQMMDIHYFYTDQIQTQRLSTRFLQPQDYKIWMPFLMDKECTQFIPYYGIDDPAERAKHIIEKQLERYQENRYGLQLLIDKSSNEPVGMCGLLLQDVEGEAELEVGYHLLKEHWGKGYAAEAARAFKDFGFENNQADSIVSMIDVGNTKSQQVALCNGMKPEPAFYWMGSEINIYRMTKENWLKTKSPSLS